MNFGLVTFGPVDFGPVTDGQTQSAFSQVGSKIVSFYCNDMTYISNLYKVTFLVWATLSKRIVEWMRGLPFQGVEK